MHGAVKSAPSSALPLQNFMSERWSNTHVIMDTSILELGFICATFSNMSSDPSSSSPHLSLTPHLATKCTPIDRSISENLSLSHKQSLHLSSDLMRAYLIDTQGVTSCNVCRSINTGGDDDVSDCTINSQQINFEHAENLCISHSNSSSDGNLSEWNLPTLPPTSLAYVMHTSGTTGRPKAVRVPHCCIVPNIVDLTRRFSVCPDDCIFNAAPLTFDPSVVEVYYTKSYNFQSWFTTISVSEVTAVLSFVCRYFCLSIMDPLF